MSVLLNPDCLDQKHRACSGVGWDDFPVDEPADCPCECHGGPVDAEHFPDCPCGACQNVRAAQPVTHAIQAKHLSGASIGKLVEWEMGRDLTTGERQWSPAATLSSVGHFNETVALSLDWGDQAGPEGWSVTDHDLNPADWVRITQVTP